MRRSGHADIPKPIKPCTAQPQATAWLTERARLVDMRASVRKVQMEAEAEASEAHLLYVYYDRAVQTMRAHCLECIMRMNDHETTRVVAMAS